MRAHRHTHNITHTPAGETLVGEYHANAAETVETTGGNGLDVSRRSQQFVSTAASAAADSSCTVVVDVEQTVADFDEIVVAVVTQIAVLAFEQRYHVVGRLVVLAAGAHFQVVVVRIVVAVHNKLVSAACHFVGAAAVVVVVTTTADGGLSISGAPSGWR